MARRTVWLATGLAVGAGSTLWAERKVRRVVEQAAARIQPESLAAEAGRATRKVAADAGRATRRAAGAASDRVRDALTSGRDEMRRREEELWADLVARGAVPAPEVPAPAEPAGAPAVGDSGAAPADRRAPVGRRTGSGRRRRPSRLAR